VFIVIRLNKNINYFFLDRRTQEHTYFMSVCLLDVILKYLNCTNCNAIASPLEIVSCR